MIKNINLNKLPNLLVLGMMLTVFILGVWGIKKNLPYIPEMDESIYVSRAVQMASTGNMNPEWFGNPGSTTIYPITLGAHIWHAVAENGMFLAPDPNLQTHFDQDITDYYLIGRLLSLIYAVLTLPLTYVLGKRAFNGSVALIAVWLLSTYAIYWVFAQWVRTDLAATFWGLLSLWLCVRVYERPSWKRYLWAGLAIGLSIASRYFMVTLMPILFIIWVVQLWTSYQKQQRWTIVKSGIIGFLAVAIGFTLITPYFFLDFSTASANILNEARSEHLGADGLSKWGNFWWYLTTAFPQSITWPQTILAFIGIVLAVISRKPVRLLLIAYLFIFLFAISLSPLHWGRWVLQLLPLLALFTANALYFAVTYVAQRLQWNPKTENITLIVMVVIISILPLKGLGKFKLRQSTPTTRIMARQWIINNIPEGSKIGQEWYTAPLQGTDYEVIEKPSLSDSGSISIYEVEGYTYLVVSSGMYDRFYAEPERYSAEIDFYDELFDEAELLQQFDSAVTKSGPTIRVFELP